MTALTPAVIAELRALAATGTVPHLDVLLDAAEAMRKALVEINEWCGTEDGCFALPYEPPWNEALHDALALTMPLPEPPEPQGE